MILLMILFKLNIAMLMSKCIPP